MIIRKVKNLTQTGTVKELTCAYKELGLSAPSDMAFDTPAIHLMYYNALKLHMMRHVNLDQVNNLQSLYCEAEKAEQTSNALHKAKTGKQERPKDSHSSGRSLQLGLCWPKKGTITANAVIVLSSLPLNLLSDSPNVEESKISKKRKPQKTFCFLDSNNILIYIQ
ncbi:hypothetical protein DSO57_1008606 [Entomophthora muscae]|uniref:Uncharacterized protein n=1 Tax=Entomophthora muscae TaxID=34485 RepID=A0ACC2S931_9FUNG|nr:hypothetical protein DSO57_1008606 [Entomophthora muscae]